MSTDDRARTLRARDARTRSTSACGRRPASGSRPQDGCSTTSSSPAAPAASTRAAGRARRCDTLAQRVGPSGEVVGIDVDAALGAQAMDMLHGAGHRQCSFATVDLEGDEPIPGAPFDLVYARLLLLHVSDPVAVLRRLWAAVAPGGHLVVHDYDLRVVDILPPLETWTSGSASCSARSPAPGATSGSARPAAALRGGRARGARRHRRRRAARAAAERPGRCWPPSTPACCPPRSRWA